MSRILFFNIPAHGHTNPTLGVVRELVRRGHQVRYYSYEPMREKIEDTGAAFIACDSFDRERHLSAKDAARVGRDLAFSVEILTDTTLALEEMVRRDVGRFKPNCIVADSMAVWGKAAALKYGIPFVSSTTTFAFNQYSSKIMGRRMREAFAFLLAMPKVGRQIKRLKNHGYPIKNVLDILQNDNDTHTIVYTSPEFQPCADTFSDKYAFVGPSVRPVREEIVKTRDKLLYISMGTVNNDMLPFYEQCIRALAGTDYQVLLSVGNAVDAHKLEELAESLLADNLRTGSLYKGNPQMESLSEEIYADITVYREVDQVGVLKKADVFLTHCGMNSVNESLYFGVPLVMLPQTSEQRGVARRAAELGAGILLESAEPAAVLKAVRRVTQEKAFGENAGKISEGFRKCGGAERAADKILEVIDIS